MSSRKPGRALQQQVDERTLGVSRAYEPQRLAVSRRGMVATAHYRATEAAARILAEGGNAVDAAVAAAFALGVCEPAASGLGGQTLMLLHLTATRKTIALDGSSRAPSRATVESVPPEARLRGHRATTVPSTPATLAYALKQYGRLRLRQVLQPAIELAEEGVRVTALHRVLVRRARNSLRQGAAGALFLKDGRRTWREGELFKQPVLAETLRRLAHKGVRDFYRGEIASLIHDDMVRNDGLIRRDDLAQIPWPVERKPVAGRFQGLRVLTFPPPGAGRSLLEMLNILDQLPQRLYDPDTTRGALLLAEVIRRANLDRIDRPVDPTYYQQVPDRRKLSPDYAREVARRLRRRVRSHGETTHLSVMDADGNAVALTQSIERVYGAAVASPELGFLYNDYMYDFEYDDIAHPYYLRPNAAPWASVAPTIVFKARRPWLTIGSPGSERSSSAMLQVLLRLHLFGHAPLEAVDAPRLHASVEGRVSLEAARMRSDIPERLTRLGFEVDARDPYAFYLGCVQLVLREGGDFSGVADPRRDGSASGPRK